MIHGILNLWKPPGPTSHDMISSLRRILHQKRIGHTGTLDPMASGILPICLGDATRLAEYITGQHKVYDMTIRFGWTSDTLDRTGLLKKGLSESVHKIELEAILATFIGSIEQVPPMHSAISLHGTRLYELARKGVEVERPSRTIEIFSIEPLHELPDLVQSDTEIQLRVRCSKGTYIRTLCQDIGEKVGCGAVLMDLVRVENGVFDQEKSITMEEVDAAVKNEQITQILFPIQASDLNLPVYELDDFEEVELNFGRPFFSRYPLENNEIVLCNRDFILAIASTEKSGERLWIKPKKVLANPIKVIS